MKYAVTFLSVAFATATFAQNTTASEPVWEYGVVEIRLKTCRSTYTLGALRVQSGQQTPHDAYADFLKCRSSAETEAKAIYSRLNSKTKKANARAALKDYQATLMTAINTLDPKDGETNSAYSARTSDIDGRLEALKQRYLLEL
jgi:hypothetical protein